MNPLVIATRIGPLCTCLTQARAADGRNAVLVLIRTWMRKFGVARTHDLVQMAVGCCGSARR